MEPKEPRFPLASRLVLWTVLPLLASAVQADELVYHVVYDQKVGELSPGTSAPTPERMVNAIRSASPTALTALLEGFTTVAL